MISIISGIAPDQPTGLLASMFEDRKRLFVDLLGWDIAVRDHRFEIDRFDDEHATYIIARGDDGAHLGSLRLLPSLRPHILDTLFADLCAHGAPCGPGIAEITRLCLPAGTGAAPRLAIRNRLICAMVEHALESGLHTLTAVVTARFRTEILAMGWRCEALGPAIRFGGEPLGAVLLHIADDTLERLGWAGIHPAVSHEVTA